MKNRLVLLAEYVTSPAVELTPRDAARLRRAVTTMSVVPSSEVPGTYDLTPGSQVGVVALGSCSVVIRPKVPIDRVLFLVSYALDSASWREQAALYAAEGIVEGMAAVFAHELKRSLRRGLLQGYRSTEEALTTVRGRIRFDEQLRRRFGAAAPARGSLRRVHRGHRAQPRPAGSAVAARPAADSISPRSVDAWFLLSRSR